MHEHLKAQVSPHVTVQAVQLSYGHVAMHACMQSVHEANEYMVKVPTCEADASCVISTHTCAEHSEDSCWQAG